MAMAVSLAKLKKLRSLDEVLTRSGQAVSAYREQRSGGTPVPSDAEFVELIDAQQFGSTPIIAETLWRRFFDNGSERFFRSFRDAEASRETFLANFGESSADKFVALADEIVNGRVDLMGLKGLYIGRDVDWHREPVSDKRSPLKHWKQFDEFDSTETGNRKIVWELNRHQHFFTLGVAFWLTGDEKYAQVFASHLESWIDTNPPGLGINWASSLEVAFRSMSWLWAFHFFRDSSAFTPALFFKALKFLHLHGRHIERYLSTYYSPNTHLTGEALGLYYLGSQLPFLSRAEHWRRLGEDILFKEISRQVHQDGVYFEQSTWYQRYTADFFAHFVVLRSLSSDAVVHPAAAETEDRLRQMFDFLLSITTPDGTTPIIGDDDGGRMLPLTGAEPDDFRGTLALSSVIFDRSDHKHVSGGASEDLFWLMGPDGLRFYEHIGETEPIMTSAKFDSGGYCVMRDGWDGTENYLLVDCGELGSLAGGHGHADALAIEVAIRGRNLLVDPGTYTYHETKELRDHFRSTAAHNTLEVDGRSSSEPGNAFGWETRAEAVREDWISTDRFDFFSGSHNGYERLEDPVTHRRSILFLKGDYWIMHDIADARGEHEYSLNFQFAEGVSNAVSADGLAVEGDDHRIYTFGDNGGWEHGEGWISKNHGSRTSAQRMRFRSRGEGKQEFLTFILPVEHGVEPPDVTEAAMPHGRAFVIRYMGYTDVFVINDIGAGAIDNGVFESDFRYSWSRMADEDADPDELVLVNGNCLTIDEDDVLGRSRHEYAAIRRLGNDLYIETPAGRTTRPFRTIERRKGQDRRRVGRERRRPVQ